MRNGMAEVIKKMVCDGRNAARDKARDSGGGQRGSEMSWKNNWHGLFLLSSYFTLCSSPNWLVRLTHPCTKTLFHL